MTDREKAGLRGAVRRVVSETFSADWQRNVMPEEPWARDEPTYLSDGRLDEQTYRDSDGNDYTSAYIYDANGRLAEVQRTSATGDNVTHYAYDPQGRLARLVCRPAKGPEMTRETYSYSPDGAKTKVFFGTLIQRGEEGPVGHAVVEGAQLGFGASGATTETAAYDPAGFPLESLAHNMRHQLIARIEYTCDRMGRILEEKLQPGDVPVDIGDRFPEEMRVTVQKLFNDYFTQGRATHKYDEAGNRIEMVRDSGASGKDTRRTRFNEHGDKILEESESLDRHMDFDMQGSEIPDSVKTHTQHTIVRFEYKYDDRGNWTEQSQWTRAEPDQEEFRSMLVKRTLTYF